jgi:hypothetical protein
MGNRENHEYKLYLTIEDIEVLVAKGKKTAV